MAASRDEVFERIREVLAERLSVEESDITEEANFQDSRADPFTRRLDDMVDAIFFPRLFDAVERDTDEAAIRFQIEVLDMARVILAQAIRSVPLPSARRYRAIAAAERVFAGCSRRQFPDVFAMKEGGVNERLDTGA